MIGQGAGYYPNIGGGVGMSPTFNAGPTGGYPQHGSSNDYFKTAVPFSVPTRGFHPGERIRAVLLPAVGCNRFKIDLKQGMSDNCVFHFNPRFDEKAVVCNSTRDGRWLDEHRPRGFPFRHGEVVVIDLVAEPNAVRVNVDGNHFTTFAARDDLARVDTLAIDGNVQVVLVSTSV